MRSGCPKGLKAFLAIALAGSLVLAGCGQVPGAGALITTPRVEGPVQPQPGAAVYTPEELANIVQPFLPEGARLEKPSDMDGDQRLDLPAVQAADLTGDGQPEIIAGYRPGAPTSEDGPQPSAGSVGALVLRADGEKWEKVWQREGFGYVLGRLQAIDITGDGCNELLVGGVIGISAGAGLEILSWDGRGLKTIARTGYHRLDIEDMPGIYGRDGKPELATWSKDTGPAMMVEVRRWDGQKLVPAGDVYGTYFPKVVTYYQEWVKKMPEAAFLWYYLADARVKAGDPQGALEAVDKGLAVLAESGYPERERFLLVRGRALAGLGRHRDAVTVYTGLIGRWDGTPGRLDQGGLAPVRRMAAKAYYGRGEAYLALGDEARARADWERARELDKDWDKPARALTRLDLVASERLIGDWVARNLPGGGGDIAGRLAAWAKAQTLPGGERLIVRGVTPENNYPGKGTPRILLVDWAVSKEPTAPMQAHGVYWSWNGTLPSQVVFYSVDAGALGHGLDQSRAVMQARQEGTKVAAFYDTAYGGSGSPVPVLYLWSLQKDGWRILWRSDAASEWRSFHGKIRFTGPGLEKFTLESDSWYVGDGKDQIFHEANPGPHRQYLDTWELKGDGYELKETRTLPS
ncbi:MAG: tetratricopeptide repeat protein [Thermoanaerobacterales bacterium]|nr:tetratricopeptide repeat protein [Thermoanaerobacterales bacterium]